MYWMRLRRILNAVDVRVNGYVSMCGFIEMILRQLSGA